ncbi:hypothetical protein BCR39DRAFT_559386 [Naematelia encephala]|uniref:Uncharacterized protein n=1 Tax=Naematelia encephala TaxID=71784 RepID=A0A1Y2B1X9_9TREE|nr:hypothetical protein BCR39DRAFT_559386 [Naematelia encephala]
MKGTCSAKKVSEKDPSPCTITLTAIICDGDMYQATFSVEGDPDNGLSVNNRTRRLGRACIEYLENRFDNFGPFLETYDNLIGDKANGVPQPGCIKCTIRPPGSVETGEQTGSEDEAEATVVTETGTVFGRLHMNEKGTELTLQIWCPEDNNVRSCLPRDKGKSLSQVVDAIVASWRSLRDTWRQNAADASPS